MFLIVAQWQDDSEVVFLVERDPDNRRMPNWIEVFQKLDTIANPADASLQFARVSREFVLLRDAEKGFTLSDDIACSELKPLKLVGDIASQWYKLLRQRGIQPGEPDGAQD